MSDLRLPAHLEVAGLIRQVQNEGGFATVLARGERDGGTILVVLGCKGQDFRCFERMPQANGLRGWALSKQANPDDPAVFTDYLTRRQSQDPDLWIVELDIADGERFIGLSASLG